MMLVIQLFVLLLLPFFLKEWKNILMPTVVEKGLIELKIPRLFVEDISVARDQTDNRSCRPLVIQFHSIKSGYGSLQKVEILSGNKFKLMQPWVQTFRIEWNVSVGRDLQ